MGMIWKGFIERAKNIDAWRKVYLSVGEWIDAWRIMPRLVIAGYMWMMWQVIKWYMNLRPELIDGCDPAILGAKCLIEAPTTQHAALVTAVIGIGAAVFGLYANSGKKWNGFTNWNSSEKKEIKEAAEKAEL